MNSGLIDSEHGISTVQSSLAWVTPIHQKCKPRARFVLFTEFSNSTFSALQIGYNTTIILVDLYFVIHFINSNPCLWDSV